MNFLIKWLLPMIEATGSQALLELLQKMHDTHLPTYTQLVTGVYPLIDRQLEDFTATTKTKVDDDVVTKLKAVLEQSAGANGIKLQNLDAD